MQFSSSLSRGRLIKRYKRFLADVDYQGRPLTLHCPNTGRMTGCAEPSFTVYFSTSANPKRKYAHTWELSENQRGELICVNTARANQLAAEALAGGLIPELAGYGRVQAEVRYGEEGSRIDFLLSEGGRPDCYVEVKSVTLLEQDGRGYFPDTVSLRAQKHVRELIQCVRDGRRAVMLFCVLHTGIDRVGPARHLDPAYGRLIDEALSAGVECLAWGADISPEGMRLARALSFTP
ncbi:DNA/RNA nuclease SfsA [Zobellella denitrificans]|uniref:Sugar fermentation stimulation protein homolog n=1 Tax=Zobellella denitrificans TaxID=347534 RepID=A0A231MYY8_9GAMM|nr:DNA/RNA nuclease SfsA [Zobellella denitrificans]ATG72663.1 transcriptional regulator [Zobellella denitrificans]OXS15461.1 DNA/RNA nuclease SfsA [Zobellella denitrificans]